MEEERTENNQVFGTNIEGSNLTGILHQKVEYAGGDNLVDRSKLTGILFETGEYAGGISKEKKGDRSYKAGRRRRERRRRDEMYEKSRGSYNSTMMGGDTDDDQTMDGSCTNHTEYQPQREETWTTSTDVMGDGNRTASTSVTELEMDPGGPGLHSCIQGSGSTDDRWKGYHGTKYWALCSPPEPE